MRGGASGVPVAPLQDPDELDEGDKADVAGILRGQRSDERPGLFGLDGIVPDDEVAVGMSTPSWAHLTKR